MSQTLKATISLEIDGQPVAGYPIIKTITVDELQSFNYEKVAGGQVAMPLGEIANVKFLLVRADTATILRLDSQTDAGIELDANGILLIIGGTNDGAAPATISNDADAIIKGIAAGT